jgi:hypothetical protein
VHAPQINLLPYNRKIWGDMRTTITAFTLSIIFVLISSSSLFACHLGIWAGAWTVGHKENRVGVNSIPPRNIFEISTEMTRVSSKHTTASSYGTTDSTIITTNCDFKSANIEKFFNESYEEIAEESAQGSGIHLEALASLTGCPAEKYSTFEQVMHQNHQYVFAANEYDGSIENLFDVLNSEDQLQTCLENS